MPTWEGLRLKVLGKYRTLTSPLRQKQLTDKEFTIISNNCWAGMIYESYGLQKQSPTVGLFFMAADYIVFLQHLPEYINSELRFIPPEAAQGAYYAKHDKRFGSYPVGVLGGGELPEIEIFFLHYHSEREAKEKWERRCKRICWDKMLIKFNDQNLCTEDNIKAFDELEYPNKICFTVSEYPQYKSAVPIKAPAGHKFIRASYEPFGAYPPRANINAIINAVIEGTSK